MSRRLDNARAAWTATRLATRRALGRTAGAQDVALGRSLRSQLDEMKGLAMKLGQVVSYMDVPLPPEVQAELARLQQGAVARDLGALAPTVERSLGAPIVRCFDEMEPTAVAAASIGQVHRASHHGRAVAVKIQYPEIADTFARDLGAVARIASLASLASSVDGRALVEELAARLEEECDYELEARAQRRFRALFAHDPGLIIPEVIPDRSGPQVLTSAWVDASPLESWSRLATDEDRLRVARALVRFTYRGLLVHGLIQADPHPGNFAVVPGHDPRLVCFDFGCVRSLEPSLVVALRQLATALRDEDRESFREATLALGYVGRASRFDFEHHWHMMRHLHRPLLEPDFHFDPGYVREAMTYNGPSSPNARFLALGPPMIWVARLQWGLWSVLTRLRVRGDLRDLLDSCLEAPVDIARLDDGEPETSASSLLELA